MNSVAEALNTLISAVNLAHSKGGVYSLEESHYIYLAVSYFNNLQNQTKKVEQPMAQRESKEDLEQSSDTQN